VRPAGAEAAAARHGGPLRVIDGAGDDPPLERPAEFLDALLAATGGRAVR
jgi:pimeloyl-ACP methyl ester carboxylesterase